jgi:type IV pilus assembly protein PilA
MLARIRKAMEEKDEGFTLIELLVVIIIIGILAAIAIPVYLNQRNKGYDAAAKSDAKALANLEEAWLTDNTGYTSVVGPTGIADFKKTEGVKTGVAVAAAPNDAKGFCIISKSKSGKYFVFDSQDGGLKATGYDTYALAAAGATGPSCTAAKPATF